MVRLFVQTVQSFVGLGTHLFVSEVTISVFDSSCHLFLPI